MTHYFLNLTNGLEYIDEFPQASFLRITSTAIEKKDWVGIFLELDHNLLLNLAMGNRCVVLDCGCRRQTTKVVSEGIPVIKSCLERYWLGLSSVDIYNGIFEYKDGCNIDLVKRVTRRYGYYKKFINTDKINLEGVSRITYNDGDWEYFKNKLTVGRSDLVQSAKLL